MLSCIFCLVIYLDFSIFSLYSCLFHGRAKSSYFLVIGWHCIFAINSRNFVTFKMCVPHCNPPYWASMILTFFHIVCFSSFCCFEFCTNALLYPDNFILSIILSAQIKNFNIMLNQIIDQSRFLPASGMCHQLNSMAQIRDYTLNISLWNIYMNLNIILHKKSSNRNLEMINPRT